MSYSVEGLNQQIMACCLTATNGKMQYVTLITIHYIHILLRFVLIFNLVLQTLFVEEGKYSLTYCPQLTTFIQGSRHIYCLGPPKGSVMVVSLFSGSRHEISRHCGATKSLDVNEKICKCLFAEFNDPSGKASTKWFEFWNQGDVFTETESWQSRFPVQRIFPFRNLPNYS